MTIRREWIGLATLGIPVFLVSMDFSVLYLATPHLSADLQPSATQQLWIVDVYGFLMAGLLVTMGTLGDRLGRKRLLLAGSVLFGAASVMAAFATSPEMLIASRALLGVAGAAVMPSVLALVTGMFTDPRERSRALAVYLTCFMGGATLGPVVGGVLLERFWWGSVFLVSLPGIVLLLAAGPSLLPEHRAEVRTRPDVPSVLLSVVGTAGFVYGLKELARHGFAWPSLLALGAGVLMVGVFVRRQRNLADPLMDLRIFDSRTFSAALTLMLVTSVVGAGTLLFATVYLQSVVGVSPLRTGLLLLLPNVLLVAGILGSPGLTEHVRPAHLVAGGLCLAASGYCGFLAAGAGSPPVHIVVALCVVMLGTGPLAALCNHLAMSAVPADRAGSGAALVQTTNEFGLGLGIAVLGTVGSAVYRHGVEGALPGLPQDTAAAAREGIDRAISASGRLSGAEAEALLSASRGAFTDALHVVGVLSAVSYAALAALAVWAFRQARTARGAAD